MIHISAAPLRLASWLQCGAGKLFEQRGGVPLCVHSLFQTCGSREIQLGCDCVLAMSSLLDYMLRLTDEPPEGWKRPDPDELPTTGNLPLWMRRCNQLYNMEIRREKAEQARRREAEHSGAQRSEAGLKQNTKDHMAATTDEDENTGGSTDKDTTCTKNPVKPHNLPDDSGDHSHDCEACPAHDDREACPACSHEPLARKRRRDP